MSGDRLNPMVLEINLLQSDPSAAQSRLPVKPLALGLAFAAGLGALGWLWHGESAHRQALKARLADAGRKLEAAQAEQAARSAADSASRLTAAQWLQVPTMLRLAGDKPAVMLDRLNAMLPKEARLVGLTYTAGGTLEVTGVFPEMEHVITFMQELQHAEDFAFVRMVSLDKKEQEAPADPDTILPAEAKFELAYRPLMAAAQGGAPL